MMPLVRGRVESSLAREAVAAKEVGHAKAYVPLFQESEKSAFWMLVGCVLVNRTRWADAKPIHRAIREIWPNPFALGAAKAQTLEGIVERLGFKKQRAKNLVRLADSWVTTVGHGKGRGLTRKQVEALPGCGKYAADSYEIFVLGRWQLAGITDKRLLEYQESRRCEMDMLGMDGRAAHGGATV